MVKDKIKNLAPAEIWTQDPQIASLTLVHIYKQ